MKYLFIGCFTLLAASIYAQSDDSSFSQVRSRIGLHSSDLRTAFQSLRHSASRDSQDSSGLTETDLLQIEDAIYTVEPHVNASAPLLAACDYLNSAEESELDAAKLAAYLADSDQIYYETFISVYERTFNALSEVAKERYLEGFASNAVLNGRGRPGDIPSADKLFSMPNQQSEAILNKWLSIGPEFIQLFAHNCTAEAIEQRIETNRKLEAGEISPYAEISIGEKELTNALPIGGRDVTSLLPGQTAVSDWSEMPQASNLLRWLLNQPV